MCMDMCHGHMRHEAMCYVQCATHADSTAPPGCYMSCAGGMRHSFSSGVDTSHGSWCAHGLLEHSFLLLFFVFASSWQAQQHHHLCTWLVPFLFLRLMCGGMGQDQRSTHAIARNAHTLASRFGNALDAAEGGRPTLKTSAWPCF